MAIKFGSRGVSRTLRVLATFAALAVVAGLPTAAQAKKQHKLKMDPDVPDAAAAPTGPVPPEADAAGHVNYGNPQAEGLGRVTVKSKTGDKVQVYLEGRYFGDTPVTVYSVPKGDYIVEGTVVGITLGPLAADRLAPKLSSARVPAASRSAGATSEAPPPTASPKSDMMERLTGAGGAAACCRCPMRYCRAAFSIAFESTGGVASGCAGIRAVVSDIFVLP